MNKGFTSFRVLSNTHSRDHLMEHAKNNNIEWEPHHHEGVNWMRASRAIKNHIASGKDFETDPLDKETAQTMLDHYKVLREHHKETMIPHLRSAMSKIHADRGTPGSTPMDYLDEAHSHLKNSGNGVWAEKLNTLSHFNTQIAKLTSKLDKA